MTLQQLSPPTGESYEQWLLSDGVQVRGGVSDGAVVGWVEHDGTPAFLYPEITGYYLVWLAFLAEARPRQRAEAAERARRASAWLARISRPGLPPTRVDLDGNALDDWRCRAAFVFDVAMVLRGLSLAADLIGPEAVALQHLLATHAGRAFAGDGGELRAVDGRDAATLPTRWATRQDVHLVKAAAAILPCVGAASALGRAARATVRRWAGEVRSEAAPHPALYQVEGLLLLAARDREEQLLPYAARRHRAVIRELSDALERGGPRPPATLRGDVVAQALRAGCALQALAGPAVARAPVLARLRTGLSALTTARGSVLFTAGEEPHHSVWASMFAHQAVLFHDQTRAGRPIPSRWIVFLV